MSPIRSIRRRTGRPTLADVSNHWDAVTAAVGLTLSGEKARGRADLLSCWEAAGEDDHARRCVIAHYLADLEPDLPDEVAWDERALAAYEHVTDLDLAPIGIPSAAGLEPSLRLNLGDGYLRQGRIEEANAQLEAGLAAQGVLPHEGYGGLIRQGLAGLRNRISDLRQDS